MQNRSSRDTQMRGHPVIRGHILRMLRNMIVMKGNFRDTFSKILRCPLKTGFTVIQCNSVSKNYVSPYK